MAVTTEIPIYVTKGDLDLRLRDTNDKVTNNRERNDERLNSMEKLLDEKLAKMQAIVERNLAEHKAIASEMRADISEIRGDVKALSTQVNTMQIKFGWYLTLFGVGVGIVLVLFQLLIK